MIMARWTDRHGCLHVTKSTDAARHHLESYVKNAGAVSVEVEEVDILEYDNPFTQITKENYND